MLNNLLFASLLALSSSTVVIADTKAPRPGPAPTTNACLVTTEATTQILQIERKPIGIQKDYLVTKWTIQSNGAWNYTETKAGKQLKNVSGCLPSAELATLKTDLAAASWKTTKAEMRCMVAPTDFTEYSAKGTLLLRSEICDGQIVDKPTEKALATITAVTGKLVTK